MNYPEAFDDLLLLVKEIKSQVLVPISVSCKPLNPKKMKALADAGVNRISIALDAATEKYLIRLRDKISMDLTFGRNNIKL